jgi:hypothetical protein
MFYSQAGALPHEKCYRKGVMPQIENVTQIKLRMPQGGRPNGVNYERKTGGNQGIQTSVSKGIKKRKKKFCLTSLPGSPATTGNQLSGS